MKAILISTESDEIPMNVQGNTITFTVKNKDYQFNLKDFDDAEAFLKEKNNAGDSHAEGLSI